MCLSAIRAGRICPARGFAFSLNILPDVGEVEDAAVKPSAVFRLELDGA
jgi:hypothetical protein